jgi:hypothetical protein
MFGHEIQTGSFDKLASVIEVEFFYVDSKNTKQIKTLKIHVWFKAGAQALEYTPPVLPDVDVDDELPDEEKSILYVTTNNLEL